jgi:acetolactate synthase-1/2/3 large subunit
MTTVQRKISDIVSTCIEDFGVTTVFGVSGGASLHLLNSVVENKNLHLVTMQHEQGVAMAADGYARTSGNIGVGITTSGPGATNLITGIAGCYYDSVPCLFITGQVSTSRQTHGTGVRQTGFQETPITDIVKRITKYAVKISHPDEVETEMYKCFEIAKSGRPGPVLIDIPDDIQRMMCGYPSRRSNSDIAVENLLGEVNVDWARLKSLLEASSKPVVVLGWGVHLAHQEREILNLLDSVRIPTLLTWAAKDIVPYDRDYLCGAFGTHGERFANLVIQESDLIVTIGSRLDSKSTGSPRKLFAPNAKKIMIDIDNFEMEKFKSDDFAIELSLHCDLRSETFRQVLNLVRDTSFSLTKWRSEIDSLRASLPAEVRTSDPNFVNPYDFMSVLSELTPKNSRVFVDTGCAIAWTMQTWKVKPSQRIFHDFNNTAMGWSLPAAIGSIYQDASMNTVCIIGDGSLMMILNELSSLIHAGKKISVFILNNSGYSMIKQTQDQWFDSNYFASDAGRDLVFPDFRLIAEAFNLNYLKITSDSDSHSIINSALSDTNTVFCEVFIDPKARVVPQVKFGNPISVMET